MPLLAYDTIELDKICTMIEFTYRAPPEELPAPLPTIAEIKASTRIPRRLKNTGIYFVRPHFVVKCGRSVTLSEGENMLFVRRHSDLCVPTLYAAFRDTESRENYLVMESIAGDSVSMVWDKLDKATKDSVAAQLRTGFDQLRSVPSPGHLGGLDGRAHHYAGEVRNDGHLLKTGYDWVERLVTDAQKISPLRPDRYEWFRGMYHRVLDSSSDASQAVFTHADLHEENILLRNGDNKPVVLDWENSGFYPPYHEFLVSMSEERWFNDWGHYLCRVLDQHEQQMFCLFHYRSWALNGG